MLTGHRSIVSGFLLYLIILLTFPPGVNFIICLILVYINGGFRDFNLASDGSIIADYGKPQRKEIYRLHARGKKFKKGIDVLPFFPISIHVTNSGQILVCVVESVGGVNLFYENRETNIRQG
jgi:hypothetical protein